MKKLSKRQKLIGFVAILIVAVIIAIVITTSIVRNNNRVVNAGYAVTSANAGSNLISNYILNGITIGGITGKMEVLDTSDASATAQDIKYGKIAYARGERIVGTRIDEDTNLDLKDIYYADIEGDGTVDGVIFADLAVGGSGQWVNSNGIYEIPIEENLKSYYIIDNNYTDDFGTGKVITPIDKTNGNNRFYVMALDDFDSNSHSWYSNARGLDNTVSSSTNDFGMGKIKTQTMVDKWNNSYYGNQNEDDIWGIIQNKDNDGKSKIEKGWFVPSKSEWSAFCSEFNITNSNYNSYNLESAYWSSSQSNYGAYAANFRFENNIDGLNGVNSRLYIRLITSF